MSFVCRNCFKQLAQVPLGHRTFSSTTRWRKAIPTFAPSATPELDAIFNDFRERVFIPDSLSAQHQNLIYQAKKKQRLLDEPGVTVTINEDEEIRLMPQNFQDRPTKKSEYQRIRNLLSNNEDETSWQNLLLFTSGLHATNQDMPGFLRPRLIKLAIGEGRVNYAVKLFEQASRTGFALSDPELSDQFFASLSSHARYLNFEGEEIARLYKSAERVAQIMEREEHCGKFDKGTHAPDSVPFDPRKCVRVIAGLLELAAADAIGNHGRKDEHGLVAGYHAKAIAVSKSGLRAGQSPHIWVPPRDETDIITYHERPTLLTLRSALDKAATISNVVRDKAAHNALLNDIGARLGDLDEKGNKLFAERSQKREAKAATSAS